MYATQNRELAGKSTGGQFAAKVNGEQDIDLPDDVAVGINDAAEELRAAFIRQQLTQKVAALPDKHLFANLNMLSRKLNRSDAEDLVVEALNEEDYNRCRSEAKKSASSHLQLAIESSEPDVGRQNQKNEYRAKFDELLERGVIKRVQGGGPHGYALVNQPVMEDVDTDVAIERIRQARTTEEMGASLQQVIGSRGRVTGFDTPKLDPERTREVALTAAHLFVKYPQIDSNFTITSIKDSNTTAMASALRKRGTTRCYNLDIKISSGKLKANSKLNEKFENSKEHGWHHVTSDDITPMQYAVTHEFGHLLEYSAPINVHQTKNDFAKSKGFNNAFSDGYGYLKENSSKYGHTSSSELLAEAFADTELNGKHAYEYSQAIHKTMVGELNARR
jgi:hypothetical protein